MEGISKSSSSRRKAASFSLKVKLSNTGKSEEKMNGNNKSDEISVKSTDTDSEDSDIVELPEGTVVIQPEPVDEKALRFKGPEFKSANKKPAGGVGGGGSKELDNIFCTACGKQMNPWKTGTVKKHKGLKVLICRKCYNFLGSGEIAKDEDGMDEQCQWCGEGGRLTVCDKCPHAFCKGCIMRNFGRAAFTDVTESENWECYICDPQPLEKLRHHCRAVFEAIEADNAKKSSTKSSQSNADKSSAVTNSNKSSSLAAGVSSSKSSSKSQSEFADDPASLLTQLFSNIDINENDVLYVTSRLLEATSTFRSILLGIQQAIDEKSAAELIAKDIQVLPFSAELSIENKKQHCAKVLKRGLQIFVSSSGQILQKKTSRTNTAGLPVGTTRKARVNVAASESNGSTSNKPQTVESSSNSSLSDNQSKLDAGYVVRARCPSEDNVSDQTKDKRGKTGSPINSDCERSPCPSGHSVSDQTKDIIAKIGHPVNSEREKNPRPVEQRGKVQLQETDSQQEKTVKEQSLFKKVLKSSHKRDITDNNKSGKSNNIEVKNVSKEKETKEIKKKSGEVHVGLENQVESANAKKKSSVKTKPTGSEESTKSDSQEVGQKEGNVPVDQTDIADASLEASSSLFDTSTQEENLFAKLELIQELAQEISREVVNSDTEKTGQEGVSDYEDSDCDDIAESRESLAANKPVKSVEKLNTSTPMKANHTDRSLKEFSDISDVEADGDKKPQLVQGGLSKEGQASTCLGQESKEKDNQSCDDRDQEDSDSVLTFSSDDDFQPRRKKKGIKRRKRTPGHKSGPADDGQEESADSSDESGEGKSKRRIKTTPKKDPRKKMAKMSDEDEESDFSSKTSEKMSSKVLDRDSKIVPRSESKGKAVENGSGDARKEQGKPKKEQEKPKKEQEKPKKEQEKPKKEEGKPKKETEKAKKELEKAKKDLDSDEEDEELERDIDSLLRGDGKCKKKRKYSEDGNDDDHVDSDEEEDVLDHKKGGKGRAAEKTSGKKVSSEESSESDGNDNEEEEEDEDSGNSDDEEDADSDMKVDKSSKRNDADLENKNAKGDLLNDIDEDNNEDDEESDQSDDGESSSEEDFDASKKRKRKAVAEKNVKSEKEDEEENEEQKDNSDSDFELPGSRKRIKSKLLDAKISDSDSDFEVKKKKGKKRKRDSDAESFKEDKSGESEDEDDDDSVVNSDEVSDASEDLSDDGSGGGKKGKGKGKGKGKAGKEKGRKRRRIKKMDSSDEEAPEEEAEGEENEDDPGSRKKIRKIKSDKKLGDTTKAAARAEEERRKRVSEKQKKFNGVEQKDAGDGQAPITTKLVLEQDEKTGDPIIQVNPRLIVKLKPHQVEAIQFMWDCLFESLERSKKPEVSAGCILAHCMGLGKTLSVVSFIHTMMTHQKLTKVKTCLVVSPLNTVLNWQNEFQIWLDEDDQLTVYEMASVKLNPQRAEVLDEWHKEGGIMIMGYEMLRNLSQGSRCRNKKQKAIFHKTLIDPGPDIVVCDEGHIMKNAASALSKAMNTIKTRKRIVLTGTPLQNNLIEYHCMVDFVKPNLLGTKKEFANRFVNPITNGQHSDSTPRDVRIMKNRAHILHELLAGCVQRRDYSALTKFLPPKQEYVISVRLTPIQVKLYEEYLKRQGQVEGAITSKGAQLFKDYQNLMKIWTHPWVLKLAEIRDEMKMKYDDEDSFIDDEYSDEEKFLADTSSESSEEEEEAAKMSDHSNESAGEGPSTGRRSRRLRNKERERREEKDEIVKEWKTRSRGGDCDLPEELEAASQAVSNEWWAEYVKEEDKNKLEHSGKLVLLFDILRMCEEIGDKVLIFSQSLLSLDIIEYFLEHVDSKFTEETQNKPDEELKEEFGKRWTKGEDYFRLDGSTSAQMRQHWAGIFNSPENHRARLFLISTRAGGLGINLIGANRVIIFDASWNPSHDVQSIFRVYRFGQNKPCYIYRFMAQGTMEEKIYDRQVTKLSLSQRVVDEHQVERHFSAADLQELYVFRPELLTEGKEQKALMLPKDILLAEIMSGDQRQWFVATHEHDSLLENLVEQELTEEEKKAAWEEYENEKKGLVKNVSMGPVNMGLGNYLSQEFLLQTARNLRMQYPEMSQEVLQMHLQRIIMMQIRAKQEEQRRLEMMERQQASQFLQMQQRYAQLQQQYLQQMAGQQGAGYPGMMPLTPGQRFSPSLYAHMAQPGLSSFHHGTSMIGAAADGAGSSKASSGTSPPGNPAEVIDLDESTE